MFMARENNTKAVWHPSPSTKQPNERWWKSKLFAGSETFKRDFVYVGDVATVNLWFLENGASGIFNLGTGNASPLKK